MLKFILIALIILSAALLARADDVYNFYFQKAPDAVAPSKVKSEAPAPAVTAQPAGQVNETPKFRRWELSLGPVLIADRQAIWEGGLFAAQYNFSRYFAVDATIARATTSKTDAVGLPHGDDSGLDAFDFSAGTVFTPIHVRVFGSEAVTIGVLAGMMTTREHSVWWDYSGAGDRFQQSRVWRFYAGPMVAINFSERIGVYGQWRLINEDSRYGHQSFGLTARF
ncbi:MAG TPA: hypothetical protein VFV50_14995 [Bdellovibrionales bacterium]|nr:hypothetical protein [Bdellovibrionales bacterium]